MHIVHPNLIDMVGEDTSSESSSSEDWSASWLVRPADLQKHVSHVLAAIPTRKFVPETFMVTLRDIINHVPVEDGDEAETVIIEAMHDLAKASKSHTMMIIVQRLLPSVLEFMQHLANNL